MRSLLVTIAIHALGTFASAALGVILTGGQPIGLVAGIPAVAVAIVTTYRSHQQTREILERIQALEPDMFDKLRELDRNSSGDMRLWG